MKISPVKDYTMSPVLARLQQMQQEKKVSVGACNCPRNSTVGPNPCCCSTGKTFFGDFP